MLGDVSGDRPATLGKLKASGWRSQPVVREIQRNAAERIAAGSQLVEGVIGFDGSVIPQLENALLAGHDIIFLGERGQAKSRIMRSLLALLDEWLPIVAGSEINDDPTRPVSKFARDLVAEAGDECPIEWVSREDRFTEKLATPDTSMADVLGEIDPMKVAEGRYLSDELTVHYGLLPRANRGIFAINELADLAARVQVGLFNILEERDVQIRGYKVRLPLDVVFLASANPEDYTNRGRIITPLKDRFGSEIRTHYPKDTRAELAVIAQETRPLRAAGVVVRTPEFMSEVIAEISQQARSHPHVNKRSGVSVRMSLANHEILEANAMRRALRCGESEAAPRVSDLAFLAASMFGKIELDAFDDEAGERVFAEVASKAVLKVFTRLCGDEQILEVIEAFRDGTVVVVGDQVSSGDYTDILVRMPALERLAMSLAVADHENPAALASAAELILEGLHLTGKLSKSAVDGSSPEAGITYSGRC